MIDDAVEYLRKEVRNYLGLTDADVHSGDLHVLKEQNAKMGVYISIVNVEEETTLRNSSHFVQRNGHVHYEEPPVHVNLYLLVAFEFDNYGASLLRLSETIELFQSKRHYSSDNEIAGNAFPATLEKLVVDFHNTDFEQLNHLWGVLGGTYFPSVLYKVRLVRIQRDVSIAGPEITTIEVGTHIS